MTIKPNHTVRHFIFMCIAALVLVFCASTMTGCNNPETIANSPHRVDGVCYIECGTCGAHVTEWWPVRNDANTEWVNVCILCVQKIDA